MADYLGSSYPGQVVEVKEGLLKVKYNMYIQCFPRRGAKLYYNKLNFKPCIDYMILNISMYRNIYVVLLLLVGSMTLVVFIACGSNVTVLDYQRQ